MEIQKMATKKTIKTAKKESRFYIAKTINEAKEKIETKVKTYNENVKKQVENGREFITELKADPVKRIDDLIDDSRDAIKKVKSERLGTLQKKMDATKKDVRKKIERVNKETRTVYKGIGNDAKLIIEDIVALGKKNLDKLPLKKTIGKKLSRGIDAIPSKLNIPSKEEIDNLVTGIDGVNKKVDALNKQYVNA
jgi:polyhydroxyalkanoate synthesis regulator phasin